jgi:hypothetical protein
MSSDTLFHGLWTSPWTESLFFLNRYVPLFVPTSHDWLASCDRLALSGAFFHRCARAIRCSTWALVGILYAFCSSSGTILSLILSFFLHNSCNCPFPFFSLPLTTMPLRSLSVTTSQSVDCIVSASVAVLCEIDCRSSACVVQWRYLKTRG